MQKENHPEITVEGIALTGVEKTADYVEDQAKEISKAMLEVEEKLKACVEAAKGFKTAAKEAYIEAHRELKEKFAHGLKQIRASREGMRKLEFVNNREKWLLRWKTGVPHSSVVDIDAFKAITKMSQRAIMISRGAMGVHIGLSTREVWNTYQEHRDWQKKLAEEIGGFEAGTWGWRLGEPVVVDLLCLGPEGWLIILVGTALALGFEYGGEKTSGGIYDWIREHT